MQTNCKKENEFFCVSLIDILDIFQSFPNQDMWSYVCGNLDIVTMVLTYIVRLF